MSRVRAHRGGAGPYPVVRLCRVLGVSPSGFYAWSTRQPSARAVANAALTARSGAVHERSRGIYGAPRVHAELRVQGTAAARKRVARLMREAGWSAVGRGGSAARRSPTRRPKPLTWCSGACSSDVDRLWVADITDVRTDQGWLYLAAILDAGLPPGGRLGAGRSPAHRAGAGRPHHGAGRTPSCCRA